MAALHGLMECKIYPSAFSGEVVFHVDTTTGDYYEGVVPKHYADFQVEPEIDGVDGKVQVRVISNGGDEAKVSVPDGNILIVSADKVCPVAV